MNDTLLMLIASATGLAIIAGLRAGLKSYREKGKIDGSVVADAIEGAIDQVDTKKRKK